MSILAKKVKQKKNGQTLLRSSSTDVDISNGLIALDSISVFSVASAACH